MSTHALERRVDGRELEVLDEALHRLVGRAVVDDDDLEVRVGEREQPADGLDDRDLLVVGRHQHRDLRGERRGQHLAPELVAIPLADAPQLDGRGDVAA